MMNLQKEEGPWTTSEQELGKEVTDYYQQLFASQGEMNLEGILSSIPHTINDHMNEKLTKIVTEKEIKIALFSVNPNKSLNPEGMTPLFFQKF